MTFVSKHVKILGDEGSMVANFINDDFRRDHKTTIIGKEIHNTMDLAAVAQVYRDPAYETFRYVFTRKNTVVGTTAISSRLVASSKVLVGNDVEFVNDLLLKAKRVNADSIYFLHNHPSGNPTPSRQDISATIELVKLFKENGSQIKFRGHVIINSTRYSVIDEDGWTDEDKYLDAALAYNIEEMRSANSLFDHQIKSPDDLAVVAKGVQKSANTFQVIGMNAKRQINLVLDAGYDLFENKNSHILAAMREWSLASGSRDFALVNFDSSKLKKSKLAEVMKNIQKSGVVMDIITRSGESLRMQDKMTPGRTNALKHRVYEVHDYDDFLNTPTQSEKQVQLEFDFSTSLPSSNQDEINKDKENEPRQNRRTSGVSGRVNNTDVAGDRQRPALSGTLSRGNSFFGPLFSSQSGAGADNEIQTGKGTPGNASDDSNRNSDIRSVSTKSGTPRRGSPNNSGRGETGRIQGSVPAVIKQVESRDSEKNNELKQASATQEEPVLLNQNNYQIIDIDSLVPTGEISKIRANISAIETLKLIETEQRKATKEEQQTLTHYVGWGGLKNIFMRNKWQIPEKLKDHAEKVKEILSTNEWESAAHSTLNAHYTAPEVIQEMWNGTKSMGFKGGNILEPAGGIGHFLGLMPKGLAETSMLHTVECDSISSRIMAQLYPDAQNQAAFFEDAAMKNNSMDLIISNVPFLENPHRDPRYEKMHLHDYFFNRGIDVLKPGGIMVAITTSGSMDSSRSAKSRRELAEKADLVGAIRLPSNAFKKNAGAEVTTDILILRKKDEREFKGERFARVSQYDGTEKVSPGVINQREELSNEVAAFELRLKEDSQTLSDWRINDIKQDIKRTKEQLEETALNINEYFVQHPEMMLGELHLSRGRYGDRQEQSLVAMTGENLKEAIQKAFASLPQNIMSVGADISKKPVFEAAISSASTKPYSFQIEHGVVVQNIGGFMESVPGLSSPNMIKRAGDFITLRDAAIETVNAQITPELDAGTVEEIRLNLVSEFERFEATHGSPWSPAIQRQFRTDPEFPLVLSLQNQNTNIVDGKIVHNFIPTGLLVKRTAWALKEPTQAESIEDAYQISFAYKGKINLKYMSEMTGILEDKIKEDILEKELAYEDPKSGMLIDKADYLSGNVREKLSDAQKFVALQPELKGNVAALEDVMPEDVGIDRIRFQLGSTWVDPEVLNNWAGEKLQGRISFSYNSAMAEWNTEGYCHNDPEFSTDRVDTEKILKATMNLRNVKVWDEQELPGGGKKRVLNSRETAFALEKQNAMRDNFINYVKDNPELYKIVEGNFNKRFNSFAPKEYEPPAIKHYPGASHELELRDYQKRVVQRGTHEPVLLAHAVGSGKTLEMITIAMEKKRLGIAGKTMIVVQNATVSQFASAFKTQYPAAKVLAPLSKKEYAANNRQLFLSRIASNDWDAVIIPQSFFNLIKDDKKIVEEFFEEQIDELKEVQAETDERTTVRQLEKAIDKLQATKDTYLKEKTDNTLDFGQLAVDCLILDEAHEYKKVGISTKMDAVKGLDVGVSKRAQRAYMKIRKVRELSNGRNVILATGTPITNTLAELYTMIRMTNEKTLAGYGVRKFDEFASSFTEAVTQPELTATNKLKMVTRLAQFVNQPQLIQMFRQSADVITSKKLNENKEVHKPEIIGGRPQAIVIPRGKWLADYMTSLQEELEFFENMSGKEKRENSHIPLTVTTRARKAAVDPRLIGKVEGMASPPDDLESKTNTVVKEIQRIADETEDLHGTQMVFSDVYQSPDGTFNLFRDMKQKLIDSGIPEEQIAIIHDYKTDAKKEKLFEDMNSGKVRVLFGTTEKMGVGVNAQERMKALHHMDAPWMPMQVEQRNGRILRHGNVYADNGGVYVQTYGVEKTMDAAIFQKILTKQQFIESVLEGEVNAVAIEDSTSDMQVSAQEFTALFSGNPDVLLKFKLESEIKILKQQKSSWLRQMQSTRRNLETANEMIDKSEKFIEKALIKVIDLDNYSHDISNERKIEINGELIADKEVKAKLDNFFTQKMVEAERSENFRKSRGYSLEVPGVKINGKDIQINIIIPVDWVTDNVEPGKIRYSLLETDPFVISGEVSTGFGMLNSFKKTLALRPGEEIKVNRSRLEKQKIRKKTMEEFLVKPFRQEQELQAKMAELTSIVKVDDGENEVNKATRFKAWMTEQDVEGLAKKWDLDGEEEEQLLAFQEGDNEAVPLSVVWKFEEQLEQDNVALLNEDIEREEAVVELVIALSKATGELERLKGEQIQKNFEATQVNADSIGKEILMIENDFRVLSIELHGKCDEGRTWNHSQGVFVDEAYVPSQRDQFTDAAAPEYVNHLKQKYNSKVGGARSNVNLSQGQLAKARTLGR